MAYMRPLASFVAVLAFGTLCIAGEVRSYASGNFALALDGASVGFIKSVDGGGIVGDVISEPVGGDGIAHKRVGQPKYQDLKVQMGFSLSKPMADWISASLNPNPPRRTVTVTELDYRFQPKSTRQFDNGMITSVTIPAMDGTVNKEPAYLGIAITPEMIKNVAPAAPKAEYGDKTSSFAPSNFKLEIEGVDCSRVIRIDSFEIKQTSVTDGVGDARESTKGPGKLVFPNLHIEVTDAGAQGFQQWHEQMVVQGQNIEKSGTLILMAAGAPGKELARIKFANMGIFGFQPAKAEANSDQIKRYVADLYVERITIEFAGTAISSNETTTPPTPTPDATPTPLAPVRSALPRLPAGDRLLR